MRDLENELIEMVRIFDYFKIPEEKQRYIIYSGVFFDFGQFEFNHSNHIHFTCFQFAKFLQLCRRMNPQFDANKMLRDINGRNTEPYEHLVKYFIESEKKSQEKQKTL